MARAWHRYVLAASTASAAIAGMPLLALGQNDFTLNATLYNNVSYTQSANNAQTVEGYWFAVGAYAINGGVFDSATATYPGPASPLSLPVVPGASYSPYAFEYSTGYYNSQSDLQSDFPFGVYGITASAISSSTHANIDYSADLFSSTLPILTNFDDLNGMDPAQSITLNFPAFSPDAQATEGYTFLTIYDSHGNTAYSAAFLDPSTTSVMIPGATLLPDTSYTFELDYSVRLDQVDSINNQNTTQGFDLRNDGAFTTAVPEPATGAMALIGLALSSFAAGRKRYNSFRK